jgi:hypothetical protein
VSVLDQRDDLARWRRARAGRASRTLSPVAGAPAVPRSGAALDKRIEGAKKPAEQGPDDDDDGTAGVLARTG